MENHSVSPFTSNGALPNLLPAVQQVEDSLTNPASQATNVINLTNSSDVVIGSVTQYRGPVTIYQYLDTRVDTQATQETSLNGNINANQSTQNTTNILQKTSPNRKIFILFVILVIIITVSAISILLYLKYNPQYPSKPRQYVDIKTQNESISHYYEEDSVDGTETYGNAAVPILGHGHLMIDREQWGSTDVPGNISKLEHPIPYVLITHSGIQSATCDAIHKCSKKMRNLQNAAIAAKGLPDIYSNFYVAQDGNVYVGRGWDFVNTYANKSLAVTFIGDYVKNTPNKLLLEAAQQLLAFGLTKNFLSKDYKLVAQNHTQLTRSPGENVYKEIIKWHHWYPCGDEFHPKCGVEIGLPEVWDAKQ